MEKSSNNNKEEEPLHLLSLPQDIQRRIVFFLPARDVAQCSASNSVARQTYPILPLSPRLALPNIGLHIHHDDNQQLLRLTALPTWKDTPLAHRVHTIRLSCVYTPGENADVQCDEALVILAFPGSTTRPNIPPKVAWGDWDAVRGGLVQWFQGIKQMSKAELVATCEETYPTWLPEDVTRWVDSKLQVHPNVVQTMEQPAPRWTEAIGQITCPVLLITGDLEKGALNTPADVQLLRKSCQRAQVVEIEGAGHVIHLDQFDDYMATITSFIRANSTR